MANCENLCTAAKCQELENRIVALEAKVTTLEQELNNHVNLWVSEAHTWDIYVGGSVFYDPDYNDINVRIEFTTDSGNFLTQYYEYSDSLPFVLQQDFNSHIATSIPEAHPYVPRVAITLEPQNDNSNLLKVQVDESFGEILLDIYPLGFSANGVIDANNILLLEFESSLGRQTVTSQVNIDLENFVSNLPDSDFFFTITDLANNDWQFDITIGDLTRTQILDLPLSGGGGAGGGETEVPPTSTSINSSFDTETKEIIIDIIVNGVSASTTLVLPLDEVDLTEVLDYLNQISTAVNTEISGQYEVGQTDVSLIDENGDRRIGYAEYKTLNSQDEGFIDTQYLGAGFEGVNQAFLSLDKKITNLHKDLARAIDPELSIETIAPADCYDGVAREDYTDEEWEALPAEVKQHIEKDLGDKFRDFVNNNPVLSDFAEPLLRSLGSLAFKLPSIPAFFAVNFTSNLLVHQFREDTTPVSCKYVPNTVEPEYIAIVANPEVRPNIKDTILILEFTTVEAFPNLNETKSKWRVQIPAPKNNITWDNLNSIRWKRGELYAKLKFEERINYVAGWFQDKESAESYFNQIIELTTLTLQTMSFSERTNPRIRPAQIETRVYRAFTVFMGENGEPNNSLTQVLKPPRNAV